MDGWPLEDATVGFLGAKVGGRVCVCVCVCVLDVLRCLPWKIPTSNANLGLFTRV